MWPRSFKQRNRTDAFLSRGIESLVVQVLFFLQKVHPEVFFVLVLFRFATIHSISLQKVCMKKTRLRLTEVARNIYLNLLA